MYTQDTEAGMVQTTYDGKKSERSSGDLASGSWSEDGESQGFSVEPEASLVRIR